MEVDNVIKVTLTNEILKRISEIDKNRFSLSTIEMPPVTKNRLRKNSKKKSSYASNKIEGNPLTEKQANEAIDSNPHKHFLKPEQEVRNYFLALNLLEEKLKKKEIFSKEMILEVQAMVEKDASKEKIGLRGPMPPGVLFAVYDSETGVPEYIPPEYIDCLLYTSRDGIKTVTVDYWIRIPKKSFQEWYEKQSKYRTQKDREKGQAGQLNFSLYNLLAFSDNPENSCLHMHSFILDRKSVV